MSQLDLAWHEAPPVSSGVVSAEVAWCGCGWRTAVSTYSKKDNHDRARLLLRVHRERDCPGVPA